MSPSLKFFYTVIILAALFSIFYMYYKYIINKEIIIYTNEESIPTPTEVIKEDWSNLLEKKYE